MEKIGAATGRTPVGATRQNSVAETGFFLWNQQDKEQVSCTDFLAVQENFKIGKKI